MSIYLHIIISVLCGCGMAIALVEKKRQWPIRRYNILFKKLLKRIHRRLPKMLDCTVCTSFWTTLIADVFVGLIVALNTWSHPVCTWPISGFIAVGLTWTIVDILISLAGIATKEGK